MPDEKKHDDGGQAFPLSAKHTPGDGSITSMIGGMSLLDYYAGQALAGYRACDFAVSSKKENVARWCLDDAEAIVAEKRKRESI